LLHLLPVWYVRQIYFFKLQDHTVKELYETGAVAWHPEETSWGSYYYS